MSGTTFDLVATISDLLKRIEAGRKAFRDTQNVRDDFQTTCVSRDKAGQLAEKLQHKMLSSDEPERSQAQAEFDLQMAKFHRLVGESNRQWPLSKETTAFIDPFHKDVLLFLERLPLEPKWKEYRQAVEHLGIGDYGCWADPPANPALDLLEMRLKEMLDLAGGTLARRGQQQAGRAKSKNSHRNPETERSVNQVRGLYNEATREGEKPTSAEICERLDAKDIPLPDSTMWGRKCSTWREAFVKNGGAVSTWLSRAKPSPK
jgi:hypothetical protein